MKSVQSPEAPQLEQLERTIVNASASISASTGLLLDAVREFDAGEFWGAAGCRSCAHWLSWRVGVGMVAAREQVRVARALGDLPRIDAALHDGRLSYSKVRAMTRVATPANEAELVELAELATATQLERICRGYRTCHREITGEEPPEAKRRRIDWRWEDGGLRLSGWLPAEEGELVRQAMTAVLESLRQEAHARAADDASAEASADPRGRDSAEASATPARDDSAEASADPRGRDSAEASANPRACDSAEGAADPHEHEHDSAEAPDDDSEVRFDRVDALVAMAETALARGLAAVPGGERTQVVLHLGPERCCIDDGPPLDLHAALRLSCDAQLLPVRTDEEGRVLDVGRARRSIPPAIRRALKIRDRGCRFPGCTCSRFVDAHHVVHWARGGETKLSNLVLLCRFHHRLLHEGGFAVRADARGHGFVFSDPHGQPLADAPPVPPAKRRAPTPVRRPAAGHVGHWDRGWAVRGLLQDDGLMA